LVKQRLQVPDVADGGPQGLHFAHALVLALEGQMLSQSRVPFVDASHAVPFALVAFADEGRFDAVALEFAEGAREGNAAVGRERVVGVAVIVDEVVEPEALVVVVAGRRRHHA
jgi:hypothetical protein